MTCDTIGPFQLATCADDLNDEERRRYLPPLLIRAAAMHTMRSFRPWRCLGVLDARSRRLGALPLHLPPIIVGCGDDGAGRRAHPERRWGGSPVGSTREPGGGTQGPMAMQLLAPPSALERGRPRDEPR